MPELQRLRADHAPAVLAFELANRAYFAAFVSDRGDEFYDHFSERYNALLAEQEAGTCVFHVLAGEDGTVLGRFNLFDLEDGTARLGYRVAQHVAAAEHKFLDRDAVGDVPAVVHGDLQASDEQVGVRGDDDACDAGGSGEAELAAGRAPGAGGSGSALAPTSIRWPQGGGSPRQVWRPLCLRTGC